MSARGRIGLAALALALSARCSDPIIIEDTARGCGNRIDDDGDGLVDCNDPDCVRSGVCESGPAACTDGRDNDRDGQIDCQQATCVAGGHCDAAEAMCSTVPQGGCLTGQGCYAAVQGGTGDLTLTCRVAGRGQTGDECDIVAIAALGPQGAHPCGAGLGCFVTSAQVGACTPICMTDADCPPGALCLPDGRPAGRPGSCTVSCNPISGGGCNGAGLACRSFHELIGASLANGGGRFTCTAASNRAGLARVGDPCDDPAPASSPTSRVCGAGSVCVPGAGGATCRASCRVSNPECPGGRGCTPLYSGDRPSAFMSTTLGYCD